MKKNIIILMVMSLAILCVVGFQQHPEWQYRVIRCNEIDSGDIQNALNAGTIGAWQGWELHSIMVIPSDQNYLTPRCNIIFKKKK